MFVRVVVKIAVKGLPNRRRISTKTQSRHYYGADSKLKTPGLLLIALLTEGTEDVRCKQMALSIVSREDDKKEGHTPD
jgi:hypothetical protein